MLRPRVLIYTSILLLLVAAMAGGIALRSPFRVDVVRDRASLASGRRRLGRERLPAADHERHRTSAQRYQIAARGLPASPLGGGTTVEAAGGFPLVDGGRALLPQAVADAGAGCAPDRVRGPALPQQTGDDGPAP